MKLLNRNHIKIIAVVSMLIDHIGVLFFPEMVCFRIIGRIAFPLFAFFIAEGFFYTKNKHKYLWLLIFFAVVAIYPYYLFTGYWFKFNILFTFAFSVIIMLLIEKIMTSKNLDKFAYSFLLALLLLFISLLSMLNILNYGIFGVILPVLLWLTKKNKALQLTVFVFVLILQSFEIMLFNSFIIPTQIFSLLAVIIVLFYNGQKGKLDLKYFFYLFYPLHFIILWCINYLL